MEFRKKVEVPPSSLKIDHQSNVLLLGSCFADNIGQWLIDLKFKVNVNPFGVLYNPASIAQSIELLRDEKIFTEDDIFDYQGVYRTYFHHSTFSSTDKLHFLQTINESRQKASEDLKNADVLLVTFGTAYLFTLKESGAIVANCHKQPASIFDRHRLSVSDIVTMWTDLIEGCLSSTPHLKLIFTVSPIRHWKDGAHNNQLSKATLLLAIDELMSRFPNLYYFPSYEIVLDELRDYRFYAEDMIHPNDTAIRYIGEVFGDTYFTSQTKQLCSEWLAVSRAIAHRPFNADTKQHEHFLKQTLLKLQTIRNKYPYFECEKEQTLLESRL